MKRALLIIVFISIHVLTRAQIKFQHIIGGPAYDDAQEIIQTSDGGYLTCGTTEGYGAGQSDILVVRTNDSGVVQWSKAYGSTGNEFGVGIKKAPAGGYIIAGYTFGLSADTLTDDFLLIKITGSGVVEWSKTYGGTANDEAHAISVMPDSGFVIAGTTASFGGVSNQAGFVVRTDKDGNLLWSKAITQNSDQQLFAVETTDDGGCVVAGYTFPNASKLFDIFVARLNPNGTKQWITSYGGNNGEQAFSIKQSLTGGFVVTGYTSSFGNGQDDGFILRLNESGGTTWFSTYGTSEAERGKSVLWGTGSGILIGGYAKVNGTFGLIDNNFLLKADTSGNVLWATTYGPLGNVSVAYSTALCDDGGYVMSGLTGGFGAVQNDVYAVKVNALGGSGCHQNGVSLFSSFFTPSDSSGGTFTNGGVETTVAAIKTNTNLHTIIECNSTGVGITELPGSETLSLYPNPANDKLTIYNDQNSSGEIQLQVIDVNGKIVSQYNTRAFTTGYTIPVSDLENGFYLLRKICKDSVSTGKFMIER